jgi:hypothetical protein
MQHVLLLKTDDPTVYVAILLGGMVLLYLGVLRPMMRKRNKDPLEKQTPARTGLAQQRAVERDMQHLLVEYEQMIRNMTAGVDTRAAKLDLLIKEAEEKIQTLRALIAAAEGGGGAAAAAGTGATTIEPKPAAVASPPPVQSGPDPRHAEVYALADQGLSARDVARRLGRPNGEIELILALRAGSE